VVQAGTKQPSPPVIRRHLEEILASPDFEGTENIRTFLRFVVEETLAGRAGVIKAYTIATAVFGRDSDFDANSDPLVRIQAGKLRRSLERYYLLNGDRAKLIIDIPKGSYVPTFRENKGLTSERSGSFSTGISNPVIAVWPFANLSDAATHTFISLGIAEELAVELTSYEDIRVIGCRMWDGIHEEAQREKLISQYGVDYFIDGHVRLEDDDIRITVKLFESSTGEYSWGKRYHANLQEVGLSSLQERIAREAVAIIAGEYGIIQHKLAQESHRQRPDKLNTYTAMLFFYRYQALFTQESFTTAFAALQAASENDPQSGLPKAMLASMYGNMYMVDLQSEHEYVDKMVTLASQAVKLDPHNQLVRIIHAYSFFVRNEKTLFINEIDKALRLNPNSPFRIGVIGLYLSLYGEWQRGKELLDRAIKQNFNLPSWHYGGTTLYHYRQEAYNTAYAEALKYNVPTLFWGPLLRAATLGQLGRQSEAREEAVQLRKICPMIKRQPRAIISRFVKDEDLVENLIAGLEKAGLQLSQAG
jgi:adenylate cyclase